MAAKVTTNPATKTTTRMETKRATRMENRTKILMVADLADKGRILMVVRQSSILLCH